MLTPRQHETLLFLMAYIRAHGYAPTFDEIAEGLGLASKSGVARILNRLEAGGFIRRLPRRQRAIEILRTPNQHEEQT